MQTEFQKIEGKIEFIKRTESWIKGYKLQQSYYQYTLLQSSLQKVENKKSE